MRTGRRGTAAVLAASLALVASGCASSGSGAKGSTGAAAAAGDKSSTVKIQITSQGCEPKPASVPAGAVEFDITNSDAAAVTEAELRTNDKAHILGEQENLTPGLSGGFSLTVRPGTYKVNCPGASQPDWTVSLIKQRHDAVESLLTKYKASPGYENTGYVDYSTVTKTDRKQLSAAVNALAEAMSKVSSEVSG
jgi:iron uptake system component EfeO